MQAPARSATAPAPRRAPFLDWVRVLAFALLVPYHVGMVYVRWDWHVKSETLVPGLEPWMLLSSPWRMSLLFVVSGAATAHMLAPAGASGALLGRRALRLLVPLLFGVAVIVPPQAYFEVVQAHGFGGSFVDFLPLYFGAYKGFCRANGACLILPTWNHLWFLPYLLCYTLALWALLRAWPRALDALGARLLATLTGLRLLLWPALGLALARIALQGVFPVTHALIDDWFAHLQYGTLFVAGAALARAPAFWQRLMAARWVALGIALAAWMVLVGAGAGWPRALAAGTMQWLAIVAALGFARRHLDRDSALLRYLTEAVYPLYLLHQTLIIVFAQALAPLRLAPAAEGGLLIAGTFAASLLLFEIVRRIEPLRPLFGLAARAPSAAPARHAASAAQRS